MTNWWIHSNPLNRPIAVKELQKKDGRISVDEYRLWIDSGTDI